MLAPRPCPICKSTDYVQVIGAKFETGLSSVPDVDGFRVECADCGVTGPACRGKYDAIKKWNFNCRAIDDMTEDRLLEAEKWMFDTPGGGSAANPFSEYETMCDALTIVRFVKGCMK